MRKRGAEQCDGHAAGRGHLWVDGGIEERPRDREHGQDDAGADQRGELCLAGREVEDRSEEGAGGDDAVAAVGASVEEVEEEDAEAEHPDEDDADRHVVDACAFSDRRQECCDEHRRGEQSEAQVDAGSGGGEGAGEGDVAERVSGEHLAAQDNEVADGAAGECDRRAGEQGVADEVVREQGGYAVAGAAVARRPIRATAVRLIRQAR